MFKTCFIQVKALKKFPEGMEAMETNEESWKFETI